MTIFGAGHVGSTAAFYLATQAVFDITLIDAIEGRARGLALDIAQSLPFIGSGARVMGSSNSEDADGSDVIVITAGFPRKEGMSRIDLTRTNAPIVKKIASDAARFAPDSILIVVTNPVDEMTYLAWRASGFEASRVMGMAGVLDTSRFMYFLRESAPLEGELDSFVLGSHGDDMVVLVDSSTFEEKPISEVLSEEILSSCVRKTRDAGGEIVSLLKTGSAYFAPAVAVVTMVLAILGDTGRVLPVSAYLYGEYQLSDIFLGVPARLGRAGVLEVLEISLSERELVSLVKAARAIKKRTEELEGLLQ
ncbi:MAG: malate dehydrogenase [Actinomycetota bacterium]|nr:malate dehydrogenase [Actinomycetota bacterium]